MLINKTLVWAREDSVLKCCPGNPGLLAKPNIGKVSLQSHWWSHVNGPGVVCLVPVARRLVTESSTQGFLMDP